MFLSNILLLHTKFQFSKIDILDPVYRTWSRVVSASIYFPKYTLRHSNSVLNFSTADNDIAASIHFKRTIFGTVALENSSSPQTYIICPNPRTLLFDSRHHGGLMNKRCLACIRTDSLNKPVTRTTTIRYMVLSGYSPWHNMPRNDANDYARASPQPHTHRKLWLQSQPKVDSYNNCCHLWG